jgi:multidrug efflux pump subunit AcrB
MGLNIQQVADALRAQNAVVPAGIIRTGQENMAIKVSGELTSEASLRAVTLHINDRYLPLTDIATVSRENAEPPQPVYRVNGKPAIGLAISMAPTGNMLRFGAALNAKMHAISVTLPHGIEMVKVADQSAVVSDAVSGFIRVLIEAVAIVLAVSFVSLGLRAGLVVAAAIPLVLAMTFTGMMLAGIGLQRISLGALIIALGLLVDDAMITVETMVSGLEAGDSRRQAATRAFKTTAFPMLTGTLVMIAGFIPVGFAASSAGEYCFSLFAVVLIALLCSWVVAILFSPLTGRGCYLTTSDRRRKVLDGWPADTSGYCARRCVTASPPCVLLSLRLVCPFTEQPLCRGVFPRLRQARIAGKPDATGKCLAVGNAKYG